MQNLNLLKPVTTEEIELSSGIKVMIPKVTPIFEVWIGEPLDDTYNNKLVLN
jgi:hypothetical protein